jgi:hypothetical protein
VPIKKREAFIQIFQSGGTGGTARKVKQWESTQIRRTTGTFA